MKKMLITGVAGMIGSCLLDALLSKNQYKIVGVDNLSFGSLDNIRHNLENKRFKFYEMDILNLAALRKVCKGINIIVHLASFKKIGEKESAVDLLTNNVKGVENTLLIAKENKSKYIFASTSDVYGLSKDLPFKEDGNLVIGPSTVKRWAYAVSKLYSEYLVFAYHKDFGIPVVVLRYFGGFGPQANFSWSSGHIPVFIDAILKNKEVIIHGDGRQTRSMAYVDDLIRGTILALENKKVVGEIVNLGSDEEMSVIDTANLIKELAGKQKIKIKFIPFKKIFGEYREIMRRVPNLSKAKRILGYSPEISFRDAIRRTIEARSEKLQDKKK
jgi:UDP-glucose 4-epimerase